MKKTLLLLIIIPVVLVGLWFLISYLNRPGSQVTNITGDEEATTETQIIDESELAVSPSDIVSRSKTLPTAVSVQLNAVEGKSGSGTVFISSDEEYVYVTTEANLPALSEISFYEIWLMDDTGEYSSIGTLGNPDENPENYLGMYFSTNISGQEGYTNFVITQESTEDASMEERILEGRLQIF